MLRNTVLCNAMLCNVMLCNTSIGWQQPCRYLVAMATRSIVVMATMVIHLHKILSNVMLCNIMLPNASTGWHPVIIKHIQVKKAWVHYALNSICQWYVIKIRFVQFLCQAKSSDWFCISKIAVDGPAQCSIR